MACEKARRTLSVASAERDAHLGPVRRPLESLALLALAACGSPRLNTAPVAFDAQPRTLAFVGAFVGFPKHSTLHLSNESTAPVDVSLAVTAPFSVSAPGVHLAGGETRAIDVVFEPCSYGATNAQLTATADQKSIAIALSATADEVPACNASDECHDAEFDPEAGVCTSTAKADGAACGAANRCLANARCETGDCVGEPVSCDDSNVCTDDACDSQQGCVHTPTTAACPQPADPCHVATCDPAWGCGIGDAPDWTPCGSMSCTQAHVCFSGRCLAVTPPDGMPCGNPSPCADAPTCEGGTCGASPPNAAIPVLWSYSPPPGYSVSFPGVADEEGNTYWLEEPIDAGNGTYGPNEIVSASKAGAIRFRTHIWQLDGPVDPYAKPDVMLAKGTLIALAPGTRLDSDGGYFSGVVALSGADGGVLWSLDLRTTGTVLSTGPRLFDGQHTLYLASGTSSGNINSCSGTFVVLGVDVATGALHEVTSQGCEACAVRKLWQDLPGSILAEVYEGSCDVPGGDALMRTYPDGGIDDLGLVPLPTAVWRDQYLTSLPSMNWLADGGQIAVPELDAGSVQWLKGGFLLNDGLAVGAFYPGNPNTPAWTTLAFVPAMAERSGRIRTPASSAWA